MRVDRGEQEEIGRLALLQADKSRHLFTRMCKETEVYIHLNKRKGRQGEQPPGVRLVVNPTGNSIRDAHG